MLNDSVEVTGNKFLAPFREFWYLIFILTIIVCIAMLFSSRDIADTLEHSVRIVFVVGCLISGVCAWSKGNHIRYYGGMPTNIGRDARGIAQESGAVLIMLGFFILILPYLVKLCS